MAHLPSVFFLGRCHVHLVDRRNQNERKESTNTRKTILIHQTKLTVTRTQRRRGHPVKERNVNRKSLKVEVMMTVVKVIPDKNTGNVRSINTNRVNRVVKTVSRKILVIGRRNIKENIRRSIRENIRKDSRKAHQNLSDGYQNTITTQNKL